MKKDVLIYDFKYEKLLGEGVFKGINEFGHAMLEDSEKPFVEGRMKVHQSTLWKKNRNLIRINWDI